MPKKCVRIIGDIHGRKSDYLNFANAAEYSIQIGDLDFTYEHLMSMDVNRHKWIGGNHDNYELYYDEPHALGDFGPISFLPNSFFLRGGFSIDWRNRVPGVSWWDKEELSFQELEKAVEAYNKAKPDILIAHECPLSLVPLITDGRVTMAYGYPAVLETRTNRALERMLERHRPKLFIFGHFHRDIDMTIDGTRFICLTADTSYNCKQRFLDLPLS
mgnify:CR=1 FL=1